jgi:hypothetical protein
MRRKHGNLYDGNRWCEIDNRFIHPRGWHRHLEKHLPGGAPPLRKNGNGNVNGHTTKPKLTAIDATDPSNITVEETSFTPKEMTEWTLERAQALFPTDPLLWNALVFMLTSPLTKENLITASDYIKYRADLIVR